MNIGNSINLSPYRTLEVKKTLKRPTSTVFATSEHEEETIQKKNIIFPLTSISSVVLLAQSAKAEVLDVEAVDVPPADYVSQYGLSVLAVVAFVGLVTVTGGVSLFIELSVLFTLSINSADTFFIIQVIYLQFSEWRDKKAMEEELKNTLPSPPPKLVSGNKTKTKPKGFGKIDED